MEEMPHNKETLEQNLENAATTEPIAVAETENNEVASVEATAEPETQPSEPTAEPESQKTEEKPEDPEAPESDEEPENEKKIEVNPADVPLEIVETKGDGVQMDLFDNI